MNDQKSKLDLSGLKLPQAQFLRSFYKAVSRPDAEVVAIVGSRGSGKTTMMARVRDALCDTAGFQPTELIDAALIDPEAGIMSTCIRALADLMPNTSQSSDPATEDLRRSYATAFRQSLSLGEPYRQIAREMSMAARQYLRMVEDRVNETRELPKRFRDFLDIVRDFLHRTGSDRVSSEPPRIIVFLDDLDLAPSALLSPWAKAMIADFRCEGLTWVLSYNDTRMVSALSDSHIDGNQPDRETGDALLNKLVSGNDQFVLDSWPAREREEFLPLIPLIQDVTERSDSVSEEGEAKKKTPTLAQLLEQFDNGHLKLLLPGTPRGLERLYEWLARHRADRDLQKSTGTEDGITHPTERHSESLENLSTQGTDLSTGTNDRPSTRVHQSVDPYLDSHTVLSKLAEVNHWDSVTQFLRTVPSSRIASKFSWNSESNIPPADWAELINSIRSADHAMPLWELPLPHLLDRWEEVARGEALTEVLCYLALRAESMSPYQLLTRMPFTKNRLDRCVIKCRFHEYKLDRYLKDFGDQTGAYLFWGRWSKSEDRGIWNFTLGPCLFWEQLFDLRDGYPRDLLKALYYHEEKLESHLKTIFAENAKTFERLNLVSEVGGQTGFLPRSLRALILLVDALERAPWRELEARQNHWSPVTLVQCVSAFQLAAVAYRIWSDDEIAAGLRAKDTDTQFGSCSSAWDAPGAPAGQAKESVGEERREEEHSQATKRSKEPAPIILYFPSEAFSRISLEDEEAIDHAYHVLIETLVSMTAEKRAELARESRSEGISFADSQRDLLNLLEKMLQLPAVTALKLPKSTTTEDKTKAIFADMFHLETTAVPPSNQP
ncbi:ATP-binding protein [Sulfidibacter corallicola]|uniref:ATP-binding protein n=1 Tax=Sulfidibacter corallicola TaxID=2818388 RepID=A0A8A4TWU6_SULCO|nr:ATP-binding protein [Sulfidibacter corallicola]QTD53442.1 ATP-binding protein [Sulfidibacter corallicola]